MLTQDDIVHFIRLMCKGYSDSSCLIEEDLLKIQQIIPSNEGDWYDIRLMGYTKPGTGRLKAFSRKLIVRDIDDRDNLVIMHLDENDHLSCLEIVNWQSAQVSELIVSSAAFHIDD